MNKQIQKHLETMIKDTITGELRRIDLNCGFLWIKRR